MKPKEEGKKKAVRSLETIPNETTNSIWLKGGRVRLSREGN
jgi:hypothetical protein